MIIRPETPGEYPGVARVNVAAFDQENEAQLIELIRRSDLYVPDLSLVAMEREEVIGHIMFSYVGLETAAGPVRILDLAPLAVHPHHQGRGVGTALTEHGLTLIDQQGEPLVLVEGHPTYYPRFGFERASLHGITPPSSKIPDDAFMVKLLSNYDPGFRGTVRYPPAFYEADAVGP